MRLKRTRESLTLDVGGQELRMGRHVDRVIEVEWTDDMPNWLKSSLSDILVSKVSVAFSLERRNAAISRIIGEDRCESLVFGTYQNERKAMVSYFAVWDEGVTS